MSSMDIKEIMTLLPHRYPFLLVDRVINCDISTGIQAVKNVSMNEPFFQGHFPGKPVMPGVLIVEAMAQATSILAKVMATADTPENAIYYLVGIDKARFKRPVEPGDQLHMDVQLIKQRRGIWLFAGKAFVDDKLVASAEIMCTPRDM